MIAAIALVGTYHYGKYQLELKDDARQFLISKNLPVTDAAVNETTDEFLKSETGATGLIGFLQLEAQQGISITRSSSSNGLELKGVWYWVYSAVEFGNVLVVIAGIAWAAAIEPFNEAQQQWYGPAQVILTAPGANAKPLETALKSSAFEEAERCCNATRRHCLESNSRCGKQPIKTQRTSSSPPIWSVKTARTNQKPSSPLDSSANANSSACCLARSSASSQRWGEARGLIDSRLQ